MLGRCSWLKLYGYMLFLYNSAWLLFFKKMVLMLLAFFERIILYMVMQCVIILITKNVDWLVLLQLIIQLPNFIKEKELTILLFC